MDWHFSFVAFLRAACSFRAAAVQLCSVASVLADETKKTGTSQVEEFFQETVVVTGKVAQVTIREKLVYLNLDEEFPATPLTCVIFGKSTNHFGDLKALEGKSVEVKGRIEAYKDKPQIVPPPPTSGHA